MSVAAARYQLDKGNLGRILDNLPEPIFVTDHEGNILLSNSATALTLDISLDQLLKSNVRDLVKKGFYSRSYAMEAVEKQCAVSGYLITRLNIPQIVSSTPVVDEDGNIILVVTYGKHIEVHDTVSQKKQVFLNQHKREVEYLRSYVLDSESIICQSKPMRQTLLKAHAVAQTDSTVVLNGESGVGKEILAQYIHRHSKRAKGPFIAVNCATLPEHLVESELFGYEKGAFTGASADGRMGLIEAANKGTLFLDEIAELPMAQQAKLLRVLETYEVRRVGSCIDRKMDFRLIVATYKDLGKMTQEGSFRRDLYYRLNVFPIIIPPLRERPEDIVALASKFLEDFNKKYGSEIFLDVETLAAYQRYNWPGNVRELRNFVERVVISNIYHYSEEGPAMEWMTPDAVQQVDCLKLLGLKGTLKEVLKGVEEQYIKQVYKECGGRVGKTAERLGIYRTVLYRKLKSYANAQQQLSENM